MPAEGYGQPAAKGAGGVGAAGRSVCLTGRRRGQGMPARSKMVGALETGEGERVPPPREPSPPVAISPRSSARLFTGSTSVAAAPLIYARALSPPGGAGDAGEVSGYPLPQARPGWGAGGKRLEIPGREAPASDIRIAPPRRDSSPLRSTRGRTTSR